VWSSLRLRTRSVLRWFVVRWLGVLVVTIVSADQITKALVPRVWVTVDPGTGAYLPSFLRDQWKGPVSGALLDGAGVCALGVLGWLVAKRLRCLLTRLGGAILLAGLASNLLDRLGLAAVTQGATERGVINWFNLGLGSLGAGNIADFCYVTGTMLLLAGAVHRLLRHRLLRHRLLRHRLLRHPLLRPQNPSLAALTGPESLEDLRRSSNVRRYGVAVLCVTVAAGAFGWAGFWQGDRRAALASSQVNATQAHLRTVTNDLGQAVLEAYIHGDRSAEALLPADDWISCSGLGVPTCAVETVTSPNAHLRPASAPIRIVAGPVRMSP
jgi:hypothetical protein